MLKPDKIELYCSLISHFNACGLVFGLMLCCTLGAAVYFKLTWQ